MAEVAATLPETTAPAVAAARPAKGRGKGKEAKAKVEEMQAALDKAQQDQLDFEKTILEGKEKMQAAGAKVDEFTHKETAAMEKLRSAKKDHIEKTTAVKQARLALDDEKSALEILAQQGEVQKKEADLLKAKEDAAKCKEEAKKAYQEALLAAKQAAADIKSKKNALAITDDPAAAERAKQEAEKAAEADKLKQEAEKAAEA